MAEIDDTSTLADAEKTNRAWRSLGRCLIAAFLVLAGLGIGLFSGLALAIKAGWLNLC